jgi:hypothetical protein
MVMYIYITVLYIMTYVLLYKGTLYNDLCNLYNGTLHDIYTCI